MDSANTVSEEQLRWDQRYTQSPSSWTEPDTFLIDSYQEFLSDIPAGKALDVAGGAGRNSIWLADRGWQVRLIDISEVGLKLAREKLKAVPTHSSTQSNAPAQRGIIEAEIVDLNAVNDLGNETYDLIVVFYFLRRELFPAISKAIKPGGTLIYRTYTVDRMKAPGGPSDPKYLLQPNELLRAFSQMHVLHYHEMLSGKAAAELVARKQHSAVSSIQPFWIFPSENESSPSCSGAEC